MENKDKKISRKIDKIIMGAIIGSAIGSVLGLSFAPRSGKETRKLIAHKGKELYSKGKELTEKLIENRKKIKANLATQKPSFFKRITNNLFRKHEVDSFQDMKQIPLEEEDSENIIK